MGQHQAASQLGIPGQQKRRGGTKIFEEIMAHIFQI
jgi:hypothetical protein